MGLTATARIRGHTRRADATTIAATVHLFRAARRPEIRHEIIDVPATPGYLAFVGTSSEAWNKDAKEEYGLWPLGSLICSCHALPHLIQCCPRNP